MSDQRQYRGYELLRALRQAHEMTLRDVAERTGYSASYVSDIERGKRAGSYEYVRDFADMLDVYRPWLWVRLGHLPSAVKHARPDVEEVRDMMNACGAGDPSGYTTTDQTP